MTKLAWMTDIHLNFLNRERRFDFYEMIKQSDCDSVMISGDIAEADSFYGILTHMQHHIEKPVYFVCGNHDYYEGSINGVRQMLHEKDEQNLLWLNRGIIRLSDKTILAGVDGWADGRYGDYEGSHIVLNDSLLIDELRIARNKGKAEMLRVMQHYADYDAMTLLNAVEDSLVLKNIDRVIIATHVPPFPQNAKYRGEVSDENFLPFYASKATGDVLLDLAVIHPDVQFDVFCGHSHGASVYSPRPNLVVETGGANYNYPIIQKIIEC